MRRTRRLILLLIALILGGAGYTYYIQKGVQTRNAPIKPAALPDTVSSRANDWNHIEKRNGLPVYEVNAKDYRMDASGNKVELEGVTLRMFSKDGQKYDEVKSAKADFDVGNGLLFSQG